MSRNIICHYFAAVMTYDMSSGISPLALQMLMCGFFNYLIFEHVIIPFHVVVKQQANIGISLTSALKSFILPNCVSFK